MSLKGLITFLIIVQQETNINQEMIIQKHDPSLEEKIYQFKLILIGIKLFSFVIVSFVKVLVIRKNIARLIGLITNLLKIRLLPLKSKTKSEIIIPLCHLSKYSLECYRCNNPKHEAQNCLLNSKGD